MRYLYIYNSITRFFYPKYFYKKMSLRKLLFVSNEDICGYGQGLVQNRFFTCNSGWAQKQSHKTQGLSSKIAFLLTRTF